MEIWQTGQVFGSIKFNSCNSPNSCNKQIKAGENNSPALFLSKQQTENYPLSLLLCFLL